MANAELGERFVEGFQKETKSGDTTETYGCGGR